MNTKDGNTDVNIANGIKADIILVTERVVVIEPLHAGFGLAAQQIAQPDCAARLRSHSVAIVSSAQPLFRVRSHCFRVHWHCFKCAANVSECAAFELFCPIVFKCAASEHLCFTSFRLGFFVSFENGTDVQETNDVR